MKKKGFTLIELLAVIVVLAIIALIAAPIIIKVIDGARKGAFEDTAYGVVDAARIYYADKSFDGKVEKETFTFPEDTKLKLSGEKPKSGSVKVDENGNVEMAITNGVWCASKGINDEKVTITDYKVEECEIPLVFTEESCFTVGYYKNSITDYICEEKDVVIPKTINGVTITSIAPNAFRDKQLTSVIIPNSIIKIGEFAFHGNQLTNIKIPNSVTDIDREAFSDNRLTSLTIPNSVEGIGTYAFYNNQLTSIEIPNSLKNIGNFVFFKNQLQSVEIPKGVTRIGISAFRDNQLQSVEIPDSVTSIEAYAFGYNQLSSIIIPNSVTTVGGGCFNENQLPDNEAFIYARNEDGTDNKNILVSYGGAKRKNVVIPENVKNIGSSAFYDSKIQSIEIPKDVTSIGDYAFEDNQLGNVTIPEGVVSIGIAAFRTNYLQNIMIPSSVTTIGSNAFRYNKSGMKVTVDKLKDTISGSPWGASSVEWKTYKVYANGNAVYYNPNTNTKCTAEEAVSITGTKSGCMKWYTFLDNGDQSSTVNLLLDHHTTVKSDGPPTAQNVLENDTNSWKVTARLITVDEIAKITGADKALAWSNDKAYTSSKPTIGTTISWFYLHGSEGTDSYWQADPEKFTKPGTYGWLYDNTNGCLNWGCNVEDNREYAVEGTNYEARGYWTSSLSSDSIQYWCMGRRGNIHVSAPINGDGYSGVRPVISVSKSAFS